MNPYRQRRMQRQARIAALLSLPRLVMVGVQLCAGSLLMWWSVTTISDILSPLAPFFLGLLTQGAGTLLNMLKEAVATFLNVLQGRP